MGDVPQCNRSNVSLYVTRFRSHSDLLLIAFAMAVLISVIVDPAVLYADSWGRITFATSLKSAIKQIIAHGANQPLTIWLTWAPSLFIAIATTLTGNLLTFTIFQATSFLFVVLLSIRRLCAPYRKIQYGLFLLCPLVYGMAVYLEPGIGCITGLLVIVLIVTARARPAARIDWVVEISLVVLASFVAFGYRLNTLSTLPVILFVIWRYKVGIKRAVVWISSMTVGIALVIAGPILLNIDTMNSFATSYVWDMLQMIKGMEGEDALVYRDYLDELGGEGSTAYALDNNQYPLSDTASSFLWDANSITPEAISKENANSLILGKYRALIGDKPIQWLDLKACEVSRVLGISEPLGLMPYGSTRRDGDFGVNNSSQRKLFMTSVVDFGRIDALRMPWLFFLAGGGLYCLSLENAQ